MESPVWGEVIWGDFEWAPNPDGVTGTFELTGEDVVLTIKLADLHKLIKSGTFTVKEHI